MERERNKKRNCKKKNSFFFTTRSQRKKGAGSFRGGVIWTIRVVVIGKWVKPEQKDGAVFPAVFP